MAFVNANRVKETTTTTGTGTLTLGGAVTGFQSFSAVGNGNTAVCCCYAVDANGLPTGQWEVFIGTYTSSGTTLARTTLIDSSTGIAINFSAGTKHVIVCTPAKGPTQLQSAAATDVPLTIKGASAQSGNFVEIQDSAGNVRFKISTNNGISAGGGIYIYDNSNNVVFSVDQFGVKVGYAGGLFFGSLQRPTLSGGSGLQLYDSLHVLAANNSQIKWSSTSDGSSGSSDVGLSRVAAGVLHPSNGSTGNGWMQNTAGLSRVASDVTNVGTTMAAITGLTTTLLAGRKYTGKLVLFASDATAADGLKIDFDGGTATMTSFAAAVTANVQGATLGTSVSSAIATDITATALNGTAVNCIVIEFGFVCNAAGTFIPRQAKNSDAAGATLTIAANSFMEIQDAP